jgi:hypothetical protein
MTRIYHVTLHEDDMTSHTQLTRRLTRDGYVVKTITQVNQT